MSGREGPAIDLRLLDSDSDISSSSVSDVETLVYPSPPNPKVGDGHQSKYPLFLPPMRGFGFDDHVSLGTGSGAEPTLLAGGGENDSLLVCGVLGADCVITHSNESMRLWETETCDSLSYKSSGDLQASGDIDREASLCSCGSGIGWPTCVLDAVGIEGLKENNGRQDIVGELPLENRDKQESMGYIKRSEKMHDVQIHDDQSLNILRGTLAQFDRRGMVAHCALRMCVLETPTHSLVDRSATMGTARDLVRCADRHLRKRLTKQRAGLVAMPSPKSAR
jgi:hypothetical protein